MNSKVGFKEVQAYATQNNMDLKTAAKKLGLNDAEAAELLAGKADAPEDGLKKTVYKYQGRRVTKEKTVTLQSGRKVEVYKDVNTNEYVFQYRAKDGTVITEEAMLKGEGLEGRHYAMDGNNRLVTVKDEEAQEETGFLAKAWNKVKRDVSKYADNYVKAWDSSEGFMSTTGALIGATTKTATDIVVDAANNTEKGVAELTGSETLGTIASHVAGVGFVADAANIIEKAGDWSSEKIRAMANNYSGTERDLLLGFADFVDNMNAADIALMFAGGVGAAKYAKELPKIMALLFGTAAVTACGEHEEVDEDTKIFQVNQNATVPVTITTDSSLTAAIQELVSLNSQILQENKNNGTRIEALKTALNTVIDLLGKILEREIENGMSLEEVKKLIGNNTQVLNQLLTAMTENNQILTDVKATLEGVQTGVEGIFETVFEIKQGVSSIKNLLQNLPAEIRNSFEGDLKAILEAIEKGNTKLGDIQGSINDLANKVKTVISQLAFNNMTQVEVRNRLDKIINGQMNEAEKLAAMTEILSSIKTDIAGIKSDIEKHYEKDEQMQASIKAALDKISKQLDKQNDKTDETNALLSRLFRFLEKEGNKADKFGQQLLNAIAALGIDMNANFSKLIEKVEEGNISLEQVTALLEKLNKTAEKNGQKGEQYAQAIIGMMAHLGGGIMGKLDKINEAVEKGNVSLETITNLAAQINANIEKYGTKGEELGNTILDVLVKFGFGMSATLTAILKEASINNAKTEETNNLIKNLYAYVQDKGEQAEAFGKQVLEAIASLGVDMNANFSTLIKSVKDGNVSIEKAVSILNDINANVQKYGKKGEEFGKAILMAIGALGYGVIDKLDKIAQDVKNGNVKLDNIAELLAQVNATITQYGESGEALGNKILNAIEKLGYGISGDLTNILKAINANKEQGKRIEALLEKVLAKMDGNTSAIIKAIGNIKITGNNIDLSGLEAMLKQLLDQTKKNGDILGSIDAKTDVINITIQRAKDEIIAKIGKGSNVDTNAILAKLDAFMNLSNENSDKILAKMDTIINILRNIKPGAYDDSKLMAKLDAILAAIKNHNVTVNVTGKATCNCNCGQNHEGILGDLNDILG